MTYISCGLYTTVKLLSRILPSAAFYISSCNRVTTWKFAKYRPGSKLSFHIQRGFFILVCTRVHRNLRIYIRELTLRGALSSSRYCSLRIRYDSVRTWRVALWDFLTEPSAKMSNRDKWATEARFFIWYVRSSIVFETWTSKRTCGKCRNYSLFDDKG